MHFRPLRRLRSKHGMHGARGCVFSSPGLHRAATKSSVEEHINSSGTVVSSAASSAEAETANGVKAAREMAAGQTTANKAGVNEIHSQVRGKTARAKMGTDQPQMPRYACKSVTGIDCWLCLTWHARRVTDTARGLLRRRTVFSMGISSSTCCFFPRLSCQWQPVDQLPDHAVVRRVRRLRTRGDVR